MKPLLLFFKYFLLQRGLHETYTGRRFSFRVRMGMQTLKHGPHQVAWAPTFCATWFSTSSRGIRRPGVPASEPAQQQGILLFSGTTGAQVCRHFFGTPALRLPEVTPSE